MNSQDEIRSYLIFLIDQMMHIILMIALSMLLLKGG
ncbi:DUF3307 domain-containing protein [Shewanella baltica]|nr:DUF3307 domain-containing protein [Shewanella baltica]MCS6193274.1 DUF3307 domain-containing protein [Shewanella baltica]MCS6227793.1 DUF3307 domain-containing protein [Shewanella baltica]